MKVPASIEAASRFMGPRQGRVYACSGAVAFALFMMPVVPTPKAFAARLGGAYYVDDAEIGKAGSCEIEILELVCRQWRPHRRFQPSLRVKSREAS